MLVFEAHETPLMALPVVVDSVDTLPEPIRAHYKPADGDLKGKYVLDAEEHPSGYRLENTKALRRSLESERDEFRRVSEKLKQYGDLTPDQVRELATQIEALKSNVPKDQVDAMVNAELNKHRKTWGTEKETLQQKLQRYEGLLSKNMIDAVAKQALLDAGANPKTVDLLVMKAREIAALEIPDNGDPRAYLKNEANGRRTTSRPGQSGDMTIEEWATEEARKQYPELFSGGGAAGGGRTGSATGGAGQLFTMSAEHAKANPADYNRMADAAAKAGKEVTLT